MSMRLLVCVSVLSLACAAEQAQGPGVEAPDAENVTPPPPDAAAPASKLDARATSVEPPQPDAAPSTPAEADARPADGPSSPPPASEGDTGNYTCTHLIGINATAEWYREGFEALVDNAKWQMVRVHSGFVELWANPTSSAWSTGPTSPCAENSKNPDRILFVALNFDNDKLEQWVPPLRAVVKNLQAKYPGVKRIELGSFVRAPGNKACPQREAKRSTITPAQDEAMAMVAAENPTLVKVMPKFEAKTCSEFSGNPPHPSKAGGAAWAKLHAEHYGLAK
jgi:hypothetical protein